MLHNNVKEYIAKGIPDIMIGEAHNVLNLQIISSTNNSAFKSSENEYRSLSATKVWDRLKNARKAIMTRSQTLSRF